MIRNIERNIEIPINETSILRAMNFSFAIKEKYLNNDIEKIYYTCSNFNKCGKRRITYGLHIHYYLDKTFTMCYYRRKSLSSNEKKVHEIKN